MPEETSGAAMERLRAMASGEDPERALADEVKKLERADRPEPILPTSIGMMYEPDTSGPQLVVTAPAQTETQAHEPISPPETHAPKQGFSLRRMLAAAVGRK